MAVVREQSYTKGGNLYAGVLFDVASVNLNRSITSSSLPLPCLPLGCDKNYHKKCAYKVPNNCTRLKESDGVSVPPQLYLNPQEVWSGRPLWIDRTLKSRQQVPHTFFVHTFKKPTQCYHCKKLVSTGSIKAGSQYNAT